MVGNVLYQQLLKTRVTTKIRVRVSTLEKDETAWIYVVQGYEDGLPLKKYVEDIINAATIAGAPHDYIENLRNRVVIDSDEDN